MEIYSIHDVIPRKKLINSDEEVNGVSELGKLTCRHHNKLSCSVFPR